jgi:hypothetical protein
MVSGVCLIGWALLRAYLNLQSRFSDDLGPYTKQFTRLLLMPQHPGIAGAFYAGVLMIVIGWLFIPAKDD